MAEQDPPIITWLAFRIGYSAFGNFHSLPVEDSMQAHLSGPITAALVANASKLLLVPPVIEMADSRPVKPP